MGQVPGEVVAAAFAVFNPEAVVPAVRFGWSKVDAATICAARTQGAVDQLVRVLGPEPEGLADATELLAQAVEPLRPEGKPLFAGLLSLGLPGDPMGDMWRLADHAARIPRRRPHGGLDVGRPRCHRGRVCSPSSTGAFPLRTYIRTRAWSDEQLDAAEARLSDAGPGGRRRASPPKAGRSASPSRWRPMPSARSCSTRSGTGSTSCSAVLAPWGQAIRDAGGYPPQGPHDLAPVR